MIRFFYIFPLVGIMLAGCDGAGSEAILPQGRGRQGEVLLVIDSLKWNSRIGNELRITFRETVEGLPRDQSMFDLRHVGPFDFKNILKHSKNLVMLIPLYDETSQDLRMRNFFDKSSIDSIYANPDLFLISRRNLFATDQMVLFMIGNSPDDFVNGIIKNREVIRKYFNDGEEKRALNNLIESGEEKTIANHLKEKYDFDIRVPYHFRIADETEDFIWLRLPGQQIDKNIVIMYRDYTDTGQFDPKYLLNWRDGEFQKHIYGDPQNIESFVITETMISPAVKQVTYYGRYSIELKGLWKTNNRSMGGPFTAYAMVDQSLNRLYYIEGFLYSPGLDQRELMREIEVVLKTFRASDMKAG